MEEIEFSFVFKYFAIWLDHVFDGKSKRNHLKAARHNIIKKNIHRQWLTTKLTEIGLILTGNQYT